MSIAVSEVPFEDCDADTQNVDSTGGTFAAIFTNLVRTTGREIIVRNRGSVDLLIGKSTAAARFHVLPGESFSFRPRDLTKVALKSASTTGAVDVFLVI